MSEGKELPSDLATYATVSSALRRILETLGLNRVARDIDDGSDFLQRHFSRPFQPDQEAQDDLETMKWPLASPAASLSPGNPVTIRFRRDRHETLRQTPDFHAHRPRRPAHFRRHPEGQVLGPLRCRKLPLSLESVAPAPDFSLVI